MEILSEIHKCAGDEAAWLYFITAMVASYGTGLFAWRWVVVGKVSPVYGYMTLVLLGEAVRGWLDVYARVLHICDPDGFWLFSQGFMWSGRLLLPLIAISAIIFHMSYRAFFIGTKWEHILNPVHVWCRLREKGIPRKIADRATIIYEHILKWLKTENNRL